MYEDVKAWHSKLCDMTTEGIVKLMEDEQIKAHPGFSSACAVSELIYQKTGVMVNTGCTATSVGFEGEFFQAHSDSLAVFILNFDNHKYPQLEA
jgi:hypothetical protein